MKRRHTVLRTGWRTVCLTLLVAVVVLAHADLTATSTVKITPLTVRFASPAGLPETAAAILFDCETTEEIAVGGATQIETVLETPAEIRSIKIYGQSPCTKRPPGGCPSSGRSRSC